MADQFVDVLFGPGGKQFLEAISDADDQYSIKADNIEQYQPIENSLYEYLINPRNFRTEPKYLKYLIKILIKELPINNIQFYEILSIAVERGYINIIMKLKILGIKIQKIISLSKTFFV